MRIWSKGLGKVTLTIDFRDGEVKWEDHTVIVTGLIRVPVVWHYRIVFEDSDFKGLLKLAVNRSFLRFFLKSLLAPLKRRVMAPFDGSAWERPSGSGTGLSAGRRVGCLAGLRGRWLECQDCAFQCQCWAWRLRCRLSGLPQ